jgi:hypothetical protein
MVSGASQAELTGTSTAGARFGAPGGEPDTSLPAEPATSPLKREAPWVSVPGCRTRLPGPLVMPSLVDYAAQARVKWFTPAPAGPTVSGGDGG